MKINKPDLTLLDQQKISDSAFDALEEGVILQLADDTIAACNKSAERILGLSKDQMIGRPSLGTRWRSIHEDGSDFPADTHPMVQTLNTGKSSSNVIMGIHHPGGELRWISINCNPLFHDNENHPYAAVSLFVDITERKATDEKMHKFAHMASSSIDMLVLLNKEYVYEAVNDAYLQSHGMTQDQLIGHSVAELLGEEFLNNIIKPNAQSCLRGNRVNYQVWYDFPVLGKRFVDVVYSPYVDVDKTIQGFVICIRDKTQQQQLEDKLIASRKLESVGLLAGGIAHDFNNILTGFFGNINLAKQKLSEDHAAYAYLQNAELALDRAANMTKQLLTFAKGGDPQLEMINIGTVIQDAIKLSLSGSNVKTILNLPDDLWQVKADKGQLSQVITNLTINAVQAMPGGGALDIAAENVKDVDNSLAPHLSGEVVKLSIGDAGLGISAENLKQIFDPYFTTKQTGSGLGLATVHSIINKHNGHIGVVSELGVGTTFTICLPADSSLGQAITATASGIAEQQKLMAGHILVMDDDEMILDLSVNILGDFGFAVEVAVDGKEAIEKYIAAKDNGTGFDIVILDLTIPGGMGGKETLQELLAVDPEVKAIVFSGYSTDPVMANYSEYGFKGRLNKPFKIENIEQELSRLMN